MVILRKQICTDVMARIIFTVCSHISQPVLYYDAKVMHYSGQIKKTTKLCEFLNVKDVGRCVSWVALSGR